MYQIAIKPRSIIGHWRALAEYWKISPMAKQRLEWIIFHHTVANGNVTETARYFNISRKTLHKWLSRFNSRVIQSLEERSKRPHKVRQWQVTAKEEDQITKLRNKHLAYGKVKLKRLYQKEYKETVSTWKIERVIRKNKLYPDPTEHQRQLKLKKRRDKRRKLRINTIDVNSFDAGKLWHIDCIILNWYKSRRTIITAIEDKTKLGFARVYQNHSSRSSTDFLKRLVYLSGGDIRVIHHDNGSEFEGDFKKACNQLDLQQLYSRVRIPKDNPALERFNRTVQDEWLAFSEVGLDEIISANHDLTNWLIEYNSIRPHQSLDYLTPLEYASINYFKVLPMWSASTTL